MYKRYVDDKNLILKTKERDDVEGIMEKVKNIGNKIHKSTQIEINYPSNHEDKKEPILDLKVWVDERNNILHKYYMKPVASNAVIHNRSAMPLRDRKTILTRELLRILL